MYKKIRPTDKYKIGNIYQCECGRQFKKSLSLSSHFAHCPFHHKVLGYEVSDYNKGHKGCMSGWDKKPKEEIQAIHKKSQETFKRHYTEGKIVGYWKGKHLTEETKEKNSTCKM